MSPQLALVGLSIVPPVAILSAGYGRYVKGISKNVQVFVFFLLQAYIISCICIYILFFIMVK